ncbi:MAG TPA: zinc-binding dehydrogenase [Acidimicrobiales bacterium]|nr:zinc-binding dehydrogenase [Acidimicrobiales bacterium]
MDAWTLDEAPGEYRWATVPDPEAGPGEVRVRVVASALNHMDHWLTQGRPRPPAFPHVPGCDVAGVVDGTGDGVEGWADGAEVVVNPTVTSVAALARYGVDAPAARGMRLVGENRWGGHGTYVVVPARNLVARPPGRSWAECAAYPVAYSTAWRMLRRARLRAGETLLVVGVGGGVSNALLALGRAAGARVVATSRDPVKREAALAAGADEALDSAAERWDVDADVVAESVGAATWDASLAALRPAGRLVVCGATSGGVVELALPRVWFKQVEIIGSTMASYQEFAEVTGLVAQGLPVAVDSERGLDAYPEALARLRAGDQLGKLVLRH